MFVCDKGLWFSDITRREWSTRLNLCQVGVRQTGSRGAGDGRRKDAQSRDQREDDPSGMQRGGNRGADLLPLA